MANSSSQPLFLLFSFSFFFFLLISTTISAPLKPKPRPKPVPVPVPKSITTSFIWKSCHTTLYPSLCYHTLSPFSSKIKHSERRLALTALAVTLSRARATAAVVSKLNKDKKVKISHKELGAVKDCVDTMGDSVDQLSRSMKEMGHMMGAHINGEDFLWHISNIQTWVSAALTNEGTCVDGFLRKGVRIRVNNVAQLTSNALALVNHYANKYGSTHTNHHPKNP